MSIICHKCGYPNNDDYNFCAKCGAQLVENPQIPLPMGMPIVTHSVKRKLIIISYLITIFLSWSGVIIDILGLKSSVGVIGFFGIFMPFYLIQSTDPKIRKHGYIMLILSLIGLTLSFYLLFYF